MREETWNTIFKFNGFRSSFASNCRVIRGGRIMPFYSKTLISRQKLVRCPDCGYFRDPDVDVCPYCLGEHKVITVDDDGFVYHIAADGFASETVFCCDVCGRFHIFSRRNPDDFISPDGVKLCFHCWNRLTHGRAGLQDYFKNVDFIAFLNWSQDRESKERQGPNPAYLDLDVILPTPSWYSQNQVPYGTVGTLRNAVRLVDQFGVFNGFVSLEDDRYTACHTCGMVYRNHLESCPNCREGEGWVVLSNGTDAARYSMDAFIALCLEGKVWRCPICGQFHTADSVRTNHSCGWAICARCISATYHDEYPRYEPDTAPLIVELTNGENELAVNTVVFRGNVLRVVDLGTNDIAPCHRCGCLVPMEEWASVPDDEEIYCSECADEIVSALENAADDLIQEYHSGHRSGLVFFSDSLVPGKKEGDRYYGIELEFDSYDSDCAREGVAEIAGAIRHDLFHFERDGSCQGGFELISQPITLTGWKKLLCEMSWNDDVIRAAADCGLDYHMDVGFHVHVSKESLAEKQILNLVRIIAYYKEPLFQFSGRSEESSYACFPTAFLSEDAEIFIKNAGRYHAINLTNDHTVEFRFFQGGLSVIEERLLEVLSFLDNLIELAGEVEPDKLFVSCLEEKFIETVMNFKK